MHVATEGVRIPVARDRVASLAEGVLRAERVRDATVSVAFVTDRRIAALNREHLGHSGPTDVISFAFAPVGTAGEIVGDVYISPSVARKNAQAHGRGMREELLRLVVHGVLHVVGHDHPEDESRYHSRMWKRQEALLRALGAA
ncbi:MAG TPA: rRNA maturation RNase YbeY [Gemmatimonadaceae bacterium]